MASKSLDTIHLRYTSKYKSLPPAKNINIVNIDQSGSHHYQPLLFAVGDTSKGALEFYPLVWGDLERFVIGEDNKRTEALDKLAETKAARFSPLVTFVLATQLTDTSLAIRSRVVDELSRILSPDEDGKTAPVEVLDCLKRCLSQMRTRQVYAILEVLLTRPNLLPEASRLMNYCPYAGSHLADVACSRQAPIEIRRQAILLIGKVGYLDAVPSLERLLVRLESRLNGQHAMPFAPPVGMEDTSLIPEIIQTLRILSVP